MDTINELKTDNSNKIKKQLKQFQMTAAGTHPAVIPDRQSLKLT